MSLADCDGLVGYLKDYGKHLGRKATESLRPLHVPGRDPLLDMSGFLRQPFEPQAHVISAAVKTLRRQKSLIICGEMGTGKTLLGQCVAHLHAGGKPYRVLIMCPDHLISKWAREIQETIPGSKVFTFDRSNPKRVDDSWKQVCRYAWARKRRAKVVNTATGQVLPIYPRAKWRKSAGPEFCIVGRNQSKWDPDFDGLGGGAGGQFVFKT